MPMTDTMTKEQRSRCMAAVKGRDTKPEILVRKYLFSRGLRYRLKSKLTGKPDMVFPKYRTVVFVDGCFWHGHEDCPYFKMPRSNVEFWERKIAHNRARDVSTNYVLQTEGWRVIRVWECELRPKATREAVLERIYRQITGREQPAMPEEYGVAAEPEAPYGN